MHRTDVVILGGGMAGLTLALQLRGRFPDIDVTVVERRVRPVPERVSTVGEAFAEIGAHYLREVVRMRDHLEAEHLPKFGLRFFVGDAMDMADRFELGLLDPAIASARRGAPRGLPLPTHQVDRARLENEMARRCTSAGIRMLEGRTVEDVDLGAKAHRITLGTGPGDALEARWVVFAGGDGLPGPARQRDPLGHRVRAAWLRVERELDVGAWSERPSYLDRTAPDFRRLSTNHLMGEGYWIWVIPLPSGVTSVGVVADPDVVDFDVTDRTSLLSWLERRDPRVRAELSEAPPAGDGDFHTAVLEASVASACFGEDRWAVVGNAAAQVDVLYSPGADLIAIGNSLVTDLVGSDLGPAPRRGHHRLAERFFRGFVDGIAELYRGQYRHFGDPDRIASKVTWDSALYFGFNTLLFRHGLFGDPDFFAEIRPELVSVRALQSRVQQRFREGAVAPLVRTDDGPVEWGAIEWMMDSYYAAEAQRDRAAVIRELRRGMSRLEAAARRLDPNASSAATS